MSKPSMSSKERVARTLAHQQPDRVPIYDKFWFQAEKSFREQLGHPLIERESRFDWDTAPCAQPQTVWELFDMDMVEVAWPDYRLRFTPPEIIEETDEWVLQRDGNEAELRWWKHRMGVPEHVKFGIDTPEQWARVKPLMTASRERVRWDEFWPLYRRAREANRYVCYATVEPIEMIKDVLGHEIMLRAMIKQPEWIHDIFDTYITVAVQMLEMVEAEGMVCDGAFVYGDIAYNTGPFMSPRHYREFVQPYHKRLMNEFHRRNMPVLLHSDGDIRLLLDDLMASGVDFINPVEAKAGMDVRELAPKYKERLGYCGNIDARVLETNDLDRIREEIRTKLAAVMPYRGYIYHSDHSVLPGTTLQTYQAVLEEVKKAGTYD
jgi:uroporphyrinogen decarboxylase